MEHLSLQLTLPDGSRMSYRAHTTAEEMLLQLPALWKDRILGLAIDGKLQDLEASYASDASLQCVTWQDPLGKEVLWRSAAYALAAVIEQHHPGVQIAACQVTEQGFYCDVDFGSTGFSSNAFKSLESAAIGFAQEKHAYLCRTVPKTVAMERFPRVQNEYIYAKILQKNQSAVKLSCVASFQHPYQGACLLHTGLLKAFTLLQTAGVHCSNRSEKQVTRIYGVAFPNAETQSEYLTQLEQAQQRSHQKIGKRLSLFGFSEAVGLGLPLWMPRGAVLRERLEHFLRKLQHRAGYQPVITPHIGHKKLYTTSGHYEKYGQDAFQPIRTPHQAEEFLLKPMNCPHHCEIYRSVPRSYRDLPIRFAEFGTVYRYEQHGALHGLARARCFTQDDAHIFCRPEQVEAELMSVVDLVLHVFDVLGFSEHALQISLQDPNQPQKYMGRPEDWQKAQESLRRIVQERKIKASELLGEAAFYGPKLDFMVKDALGRAWQLGTVQLDYQLPERFDLCYTGDDGLPHRPVLIHRAPFGSLERLIALLLEQSEGKLPLWLSPDQVTILPISEKHVSYARTMAHQLELKEVRTAVDARAETIGKKIRDAEQLCIPCLAIVGDREVEAGTMAIRLRGRMDKGSMSLAALMNWLHQEGLEAPMPSR